jgi:OHCU decarboxylase
VTLDGLNSAPRDVAERELAACCGSARWAAAVAARRPFASATQLFATADDVWQALDRADWREAFGRHPRIGDKASGWAGDEQSASRDASAETKSRLADLNRQYERKFGFVFLIFATGKSASEILATLERRLQNDADAELRVAAAEQAKITRLRLEKLLRNNAPASRAG